MLTPDEAAQKADRAADQLLKTSARWRASLEGRVVQPPLLIQRLDVNEPYYIVPFTRNGRHTAHLIVDATSGELAEANAVENVGDSLPAYLVPPSAPPSGLPRQLVWQPCRESSSPFLPFYVLEDGEYFRVDGKTFTTLTLAPA